MQLVQFKDDVSVKETVGLEGVVAEDEHPGAGYTSESARAARDLERGLDRVVRIAVVEVEHARWGMAAYCGECRHLTVRAAYDDAGDGVTASMRDRESSGECLRADIKTTGPKVGALTVGGIMGTLWCMFQGR